MAAKNPDPVARRTEHATFVIDRHFRASPAQVFAAWSDRDAKAAWFSGTVGRWTEEVRELDFRVGGRERLRGQWLDGPVSDFTSTFQDIVPGERIVYSYDMHIDDRRISVSLATIEFLPVAGGTRLVLTEQGVFLDGLDQAAQREHGTRALIDKLEAALTRVAP